MKNSIKLDKVRRFWRQVKSVYQAAALVKERDQFRKGTNMYDVYTNIIERLMEPYTPAPSTQGFIYYKSHEGLSDCHVREDEMLPETWAALMAAPWLKGHPGQFTKQVVDEFATYTAYTSLCQDCGAPFYMFGMVMLRDALWARLYPDNGIACPDCMSKRLGRPIENKDRLFRV